MSKEGLNILMTQTKKGQYSDHKLRARQQQEIAIKMHGGKNEKIKERGIKNLNHIRKLTQSKRVNPD